MKIFNRGNISYFIAPIIILILMYAIFTFTLVLNKANAAQNIKINSDFELFDQNNKKIKNTKKKSSRQKQRTAKKIKHSRRKLLGGKAKIDMAYTYLAFDLNLIKQYTLLNDWVHKHSLLCSCKAISTDVTNCKLSNQSGWVIDEQQEIILVSKFDTIQNIYFNKFDLKKAKKVFGYSILYLFLIFVLF